jgi:hypothetical protein
MHGAFGNPRGVETEIQGQFVPGRDTIVTCRFAVAARALWPVKTAAHLAAIAGRDERTAKRWLSGEFEPPNCVIAAIVLEITKRP